MKYSTQTKKKIKLFLKLLQPLRYLEFSIVLPVIFFYLLFWKVYLLFFGYLDKIAGQKRILHLQPALISALKEKGNFSLALEKDLDGFFDFTIVNYRSAGKQHSYQYRENYLINDSPSKIYLFPGVDTLIHLNYLCKQIYRNNINIIHVTYPFYLGMVGLLCSQVFGIPLTLSIHAPYDEYVKKRGKAAISHIKLPLLEYFFQRIVFKKADMVMTIDPYYKKYIFKKRGSNHQIYLIPHGIDTNWWGKAPDFNIKEKLGLKGKKIIVLVCRIAKDKEVHLVPKIAKIVVEKHPKIVFVWAGDGDYKETLEKILLKLGLHNYSRFLGFQDKKTVKRLRYAADVNLCIWDGFSQLEAMISGRPVVCGYNYFNSIKNKINGISIDNWQNNPKGYAQAINFLLDNPKIGDKLGQLAREEVIKKFSLDYTNKVKKKLYLRVFNNIKNYEKKKN